MASGSCHYIFFSDYSLWLANFSLQKEIIYFKTNVNIPLAVSEHLVIERVLIDMTEQMAYFTAWVYMCGTCLFFED